MRVLVIAAGLADLGPLGAGTAVGAPWADLGHQVAVVPIGTGGQTLVDAASSIPGTAVLRPRAGESSADLGRELTAAVEADVRTILVDLTGDCPDDAGPGLLEALGGRDVLAGRSLVGVVREDELDAALLGVRGVAARRSYASGTPDIGAALAGDAVLSRLAAGIGMPDPPPGAGAGNGLALAVLALGGVVRTGPQAIGELVGIERSLEAADLVVLSGGTSKGAGDASHRILGPVRIQFQYIENLPARGQQPAQRVGQRKRNALALPMVELVARRVARFLQVIQRPQPQVHGRSQRACAGSRVF